MTAQEQSGVHIGSDAPTRSAQGLPPDFGAWFRDHRPTVYRYVRFRLATREAAEDVTSETFMKALRALDRYDPGRADSLGADAVAAIFEDRPIKVFNHGRTDLGCSLNGALNQGRIA